MKKLFRCLTLVLLVCLIGTTSYPMVEQKIPKINDDSAEHFIESIGDLLEQGFDQKTIVAAIKRQNVNVHVQGAVLLHGWNALHINTFYDNKHSNKHRLHVTQILIDAGAHVNSRVDSPRHPYHDCTPLHLALFKQEFECAQIFMSARANVNAKINNRGPHWHLLDYHDWTPLDIAMHKFLEDNSGNYYSGFPTRRYIPMIRSLVALGADIEDALCNIKGMQPLSAHNDIIDAIIQGKMDEQIARKKEDMQELTVLLQGTSLS